MNYFIIPCGAAKTDEANAARDLYTGSAFRMALTAAIEEAAATERDLGQASKVMILSALHGLVDLDTVLDPYDVKMGDEGSVEAWVLAEQAAYLGFEYGDTVVAMLPKAYREVLAKALDALDITVMDVYEASPGIGYQRGTAASITRSAAMVWA
jgi:hypothetical protein